MVDFHSIFFVTTCNTETTEKCIHCICTLLTFLDIVILISNVIVLIYILTVRVSSTPHPYYYMCSQTFKSLPILMIMKTYAMVLIWSPLITNEEEYVFMLLVIQVSTFVRYLFVSFEYCGFLWNSFLIIRVIYAQLKNCKEKEITSNCITHWVNIINT